MGGEAGGSPPPNNVVLVWEERLGEALPPIMRYCEGGEGMGYLCGISHPSIAMKGIVMKGIVVKGTVMKGIAMKGIVMKGWEGETLPRV